ncbi:MAG: glycosyltransferase family 9 protein [Spirochaetes bacterium]|nr:glycosyltransferase family 9 protein [Spirochaetota bacterium]
MKFLVIKQTSLGDVLHATPFIRAIKKHYPEAQIDVVVDKRATDILSANPYIHRLHIVDIYRYEHSIFSSPVSCAATIRSFMSDIAAVRAETYDAAFDLQGLARSAVFLYTARAKSKFAKGRWLGIPHLYYKDIHAVHGLLQFLSFISVPDDGPALDFFLPEDIAQRVAHTLQKKNILLPKQYILYAPYSRWQTKDIPLETSIALLQQMANRFKLPIVISATNDYREQCIRMAEAVPRAIPLTVFTSLAELGYVIQQAKGMVSVDSFPMHAATAFDIPLVALFGPTSEKRIGPLSRNSVVVRNSAIDCSRCYRRTCPYNHECMRELSPETIITSLATVMKQSNDTSR